MSPFVIFDVFNPSPLLFSVCNYFKYTLMLHSCDLE